MKKFASEKDLQNVKNAQNKFNKTVLQWEKVELK